MQMILIKSSLLFICRVVNKPDNIFKSRYWKSQIAKIVFEKILNSMHFLLKTLILHIDLYWMQYFILGIIDFNSGGHPQILQCHQLTVIYFNLLLFNPNIRMYASQIFYIDTNIVFPCCFFYYEINIYFL